MNFLLQVACAHNDYKYVLAYERRKFYFMKLNSTPLQ